MPKPGLFQSVLWNFLLLAFAVGTFAGLSYLGLPFELIILLVLLVFGVLYLGGRPAYPVVFLVIFLSIFINNANYTFFSFSAGGEEVNRGEEVRLLVLLRLPLVLFAVGLVLAKHGARFLRFLGRNWDIAVFSLLPLVNIAFSVNKVAAMQYGTWFTFSLLTILAFVYLLGTRVPGWRWSEHAAWLVLGAYVPIVFLTLPSAPALTENLRGAAYSDSNFYAYACAVVLVAVLVLERQHGRVWASRFLKKIPFWVLFGIGVAAAILLLLSAKKAAILSTALALLIYTLSRKSSASSGKIANLLRPALIVVAILATIWFVLPRAQMTTHRFEKAVDKERNTGVQFRLELWETAVGMTLDVSPLFGVGLANGKTALATYLRSPEDAAPLHSTPVAIFTEMGGVGFFFFLLIVLRSLRAFQLRCPPPFRRDLLLLALPPVLISITEYNLIPGQAIFWPLWLVAVLPRIGSARVRPKQPHRVRRQGYGNASLKARRSHKSVYSRKASSGFGKS